MDASRMRKRLSASKQIFVANIRLLKKHGSYLRAWKMSLDRDGQNLIKGFTWICNFHGWAWRLALTGNRPSNN